MRTRSAILFSTFIILIGFCFIITTQLGCGGDDEEEEEDSGADCNSVADSFLDACPEYDFSGYDFHGSAENANEAYNNLCTVYEDASCLNNCMGSHSGDCQAMADCYFENDCEYNQPGGECDQTAVNACAAGSASSRDACYKACNDNAEVVAPGDCSALVNICYAECYATEELENAQCIREGNCETAETEGAITGTIVRGVPALLCRANYHYKQINCMAESVDVCDTAANCSADGYEQLSQCDALTE